MDGVTSIDGDFIISLSEKAKKSQRKRVVHELHASHQSPCQRILNAIEPESYIRPHRHVDRDEYFTCLSGCLICIFFTEDGQIEDVVDISVHSDVASIIVGVEIARWHTVLSLKSGSVLFETKDGPFIPALSKEFASDILSLADLNNSLARSSVRLFSLASTNASDRSSPFFWRLIQKW